MAVEGFAKLMKWLLVIFNGLVLIASGIAVGVGVWSYIDELGADKMDPISGSNLYAASCLVLIFGGAIVIVVSLFGFCGAFMENRCLLGVHFSVLIFLLVVYTAGIILGYVYKDTLEEELEEEMRKTLLEQFNDGVDKKEDGGVSEVWNKIQKKLKCCGLSGGLKSNTSWFMWQESKWFKSQIVEEMNRDYVPNSCCNLKDGHTFKDCTKLNNEDNGMPIKTDLSQVKTENPALYSEGCFDKVKDEIQVHAVAIGVAAVVTLTFSFLTIAFAMCVFFHIEGGNMVV